MPTSSRSGAGSGCSGNPVLVELRGVGVRYGEHRGLTGVDLTIRAGERVAVIGPSGAGKSTLARVLNGTLAPSTGTVRVLGVDLAAASARGLRAVQHRVGTIHQSYQLVGELRVVHNVNAGRLGEWSWWRAVWSLLRPREVEAARAALQQVGLADRIDQRTATLSGGEQQRVAIARVLRQRPRLILADEPVASLDPARAAEVIALLRAVADESGAALVAIVHDLAVAGQGFDRILGLRDGAIVFDTPADRLTAVMTTALYELAEVPAEAPPAARRVRRTC
jgi:phosphonate transport system ATP-binding protein